MSTAVATTDQAIEPAQAPRLPTIHAGGAVRAIVPQDFDSAWRIANAVCKAQMAPRGLDTPEKAMVAIMHGLEVGLTPMNALQSIAVVNGRPTIWGDGAIGLVRGSGLLEWMEEKFEGKEGEDGFKAVCLVKRKGEPKPVRGEFSIADAKAAGLWGKSGPWQQYKKRMLQMRARAFALRDAFADVLKGLAIKEEVEDYRETTVRHDDEPPAPPPPAQLAGAERVVDPPIIDADPPAPETAKDPEPEPQPSQQAVKPADMPDPAADPEAFVKWWEKRAAAIPEDQAETLVMIWEGDVEPVLGALFPPDMEVVTGIYKHHCKRLGVEG
jgi:hypothetical protein